ncbi:ABC transporter permease [Streptomyces syringium]|uniref:ABC transporter permease n=1 Tax=Streptomyces syringium TaxID=76729 RepID=UPI0036A788EC
MGNAALIKVVAAREITQQMRSKAFWISVAVTALMLALSFGATTLFQGGGEGTSTVGVVGRQAALTPALGDRAEVSRYDNDEAARQAVRDGKIDAAVLSSDRIAVLRELPEDLGRALQEAHRAAGQAGRLAEHGVPAKDVPGLLTVEPLKVTTLDPDAERGRQRTIAAGTGVFLLFMLMLVSGLAVAQGVAEEKASRIVEVLLAKVRPWHLLAGKITGLGAAALVQMLALATATLSAAIGFGVFETPSDALGTGANLLLWFIPGYLLFITLYAVAGSLVSRPEDVNHVVGPVNALQMVGLIGPVLAVSGSTDSATLRILSMVPGTSWASMPVRMAYEDVAWWEIGAAFGLMALAIAVLVRVGSRVYTGGLLQYGGIVKVKDALAGARQ